jgi:hypothetical protein
LFLFRARSLSLCLADPTRQPVPNLPPTSLDVDAATSARSLASSARPRPFRPVPYLPTSPCSLVPSVELSHPSLALHTRPGKLRHRSPRTTVVPRPLLSPRHARSVGMLCLITCSSGHLLVRTSPSGLPSQCSSEHFLRIRSPPLSTRGFIASPPSSRHS